MTRQTIGSPRTNGQSGATQSVPARSAVSHSAAQIAQPLHSETRLTLTIPEACLALGIGETMLRQMIHTGQLPILKIGRRVLIPRQAVEQLVADACTRQEVSTGIARAVGAYTLADAGRSTRSSPRS